MNPSPSVTGTHPWLSDSSSRVKFLCHLVDEWNSTLINSNPVKFENLEENEILPENNFTDDEIGKKMYNIVNLQNTLPCLVEIGKQISITCTNKSLVGLVGKYVLIMDEQTCLDTLHAFIQQVLILNSSTAHQLLSACLSSHILKFPKSLPIAWCEIMKEFFFTESHNPHFINTIVDLLCIKDHHQSDFILLIVRETEKFTHPSLISKICHTADAWSPQNYRIISELLSIKNSDSSISNLELHSLIVSACCQHHLTQQTSSSIQFVKLLMVYIKQHKNDIPSTAMLRLRELASRNQSFLKNSLISLLDSMNQ